LLDISKIWDKIAKEDLATGENRQNALLELMAGKNRSNILASVLESPEVLEKAYKYALDSDGSALEENEAYLESISGHVAKLQNQWQSLWAETANRDLINWFLDAATAVLKLADEIGAVNLLLFGGGGIFAAIKTIKGDGKWGFKIVLISKFIKYAVSNVYPYGYISFYITLYEIHKVKRVHAICDKVSTLYSTLLFRK
jgi:hypothetical protein